MIRAVVTDIEGTTSSISFVSNTLFPYAREHMQDFIAVHSESGEISWLMDDVRELTGKLLDEEGVVEQLIHWIDADEKVTPLKTIQGMIWEDGYRRGDFTGHVYEDAMQCMKQWHKNGVKLYVYSSGSVQAQELLFTFSDYGDLSLLFSGYFDTHIGGKKESASYEEIVRQLELPADEILFLSDIKEELDAARNAGMQVCWLMRSDKDEADAGYVCARDFNQVNEQFFVEAC